MKRRLLYMTIMIQRDYVTFFARRKPWAEQNVRRRLNDMSVRARPKDREVYYEFLNTPVSLTSKLHKTRKPGKLLRIKKFTPKLRSS